MGETGRVRAVRVSCSSPASPHSVNNCKWQGLEAAFYVFPRRLCCRRNNSDHHAPGTPIHYIVLTDSQDDVVRPATLPNLLG